MTTQWSELTPEAKKALAVEALDLLAKAPNQAVVPVLIDQMMKHPEIIPSFVEGLRENVARLGFDIH